MLNIHRITLLVDHTLNNQQAIARAKALCQTHHATLQLVSHTYSHACEEGSLSDHELRHNLKALLIQRQYEWLAELIREHHLPENTEKHVFWTAHSHSAANMADEPHPSQLIIKAAGKHHTLINRLLDHQDWNLMNHADAPVLLVKSRESWSSGKILIALDAASKDDEHQIINDHLLEYAEMLNTSGNLQLNLVNSYPSLSLVLAGLPETPVPDDLQQYVIKQHENGCERYAHHYNVPMEQVHIREGEAENVICEVAKQIDADVIMVGVLPDVGMSEVLLGSTVEYVLDHTDADVLALKRQDGVDTALE